MIELPEATVIAQQIQKRLGGRRVVSAVAGASPHKFAWYSGDPSRYNDRLAGKSIGETAGVAGHIEVYVGDMVMSISAPIRYHGAGERRPKKHQLLIELDDGTAISSSAQMWGAFMCFPQGEPSGVIDYEAGKEKPSPLTDAFDRAYFSTLFDADTPKLAAKAFLATEQRIPGLGNGVLQDILWTAHIHPKVKMSDLSKLAVDTMYDAVKTVLAAMALEGGRDTERDLFGQPGGYATILSRNTVDKPCPACGTLIEKQQYLGGAIYFCSTCQPLHW